MRIAVDARCLSGEIKDDAAQFGFEILRQLSLQHPEQEFIFFFDKKYNEEVIFNDNVTPVILSPEADNPIKWYLWYEIKLAKALKKQRADLLLASSGMMPSGIKIPATLLLHYLPTDNKNLSLAERKFFKKYIPKYLAKAQNIITTSNWMKKYLQETFKVGGEKIKVMSAGAEKETHPLDWEDREAIKAQYAQDQEYFIYIGTIQNEKKLPVLLKAFSAMKKRLRSNVKLLIVGYKGEVNLQLQELLKTFYFRNDVKLISHLDNAGQLQVVRAAYAFVSPLTGNNFSLAALEALKAGVPIIAAGNSPLAEIVGEAGLYFNPEEEESLPNQLALIYKDERRRNLLVNKAEAIGKNFDWGKAARELFGLSVACTLSNDDDDRSLMTDHR